jgi:hypothetical protein
MFFVAPAACSAADGVTAETDDADEGDDDEDEEEEADALGREMGGGGAASPPLDDEEAAAPLACAAALASSLFRNARSSSAYCGSSLSNSDCSATLNLTPFIGSGPSSHWHIGQCPQIWFSSV